MKPIVTVAPAARASASISGGLSRSQEMGMTQALAPPTSNAPAKFPRPRLLVKLDSFLQNSPDWIVTRLGSAILVKTRTSSCNFIPRERLTTSIFPTSIPFDWLLGSRAIPPVTAL
jgi:hypothetical protein